VVRQLVDVGVDAVEVGLLGRHGDPVVVTDTAAAQELAVYGVPHQRVAEGVALTALPYPVQEP
jgi:hypothetical protein